MRFRKDFSVCAGRCHNLKNGKEASEVTGRKIQQDALGKVNSVKEIRRRENDGLKITDNMIMRGRPE